MVISPSGGGDIGRFDGLKIKNAPTATHMAITAIRARILFGVNRFLFLNIGNSPSDCGGISSGKEILFDMVDPFIDFLKFYSSTVNLSTHLSKI